MKTRKTAAKRFKITKKKKVLQRVATQDHFNARERGKDTRNKRRDRVASKSNRKNILKQIPYGSR